MSNRNVEKNFVYLLLVSLFIHLALGTMLYLMPPEKMKPVQETTMVELKDLPEPPSPRAEKAKPVPEPKPEPKPLPKPIAVPIPRVPILPPERFLPKAENETERIAQGKSASKVPEKSEPKQQPVTSPGSSESAQRTPGKAVKEAPPGEGLASPQRGSQGNLAKFFPSARNLGKFEDGFRQKYLEAEQGDTQLMDTADPVIGVFKQRFRDTLTERLNAIDPLVRKGVGTTVLKITFKRDGTIRDIGILYSTGNKLLDDLAIKATLTSSYVGPLPKKWPHDSLSVIWSFMILDDVILGRWR